MAGGEYISMRAQVELLDRLLVEEREAIRTDPERENAVLVLALASGITFLVGTRFGTAVF